MSDFIDYFEDFDASYDIWEFADSDEYLETMVKDFSPLNSDKWKEDITNQFESRAKEVFDKKTSLVNKAKEILTSENKWTENKEEKFRKINTKLYHGEKLNKGESNMAKSIVFKYTKQIMEESNLTRSEAMKEAWEFVKGRKELD